VAPEGIAGTTEVAGVAENQWAFAAWNAYVGRRGVPLTQYSTAVWSGLVAVCT